VIIHIQRRVVEQMFRETRQKILEATARPLQMKGRERVTTKEIARETGLFQQRMQEEFFR